MAAIGSISYGPTFCWCWWYSLGGNDWVVFGVHGSLGSFRATQLNVITMAPGGASFTGRGFWGTPSGTVTNWSYFDTPQTTPDIGIYTPCAGDGNATVQKSP